MTVPPPVLEPRGFQELVDEAVARIPIHNPEWTNFNRSDPGITLLELFAFMAESIGYRANLVPERNRRAFLSLLGVPRRGASSARGLVTIANERAPLVVQSLPPRLELRAGTVAFRTERGIDVLPVEGHAFVKRTLDAPDRLVAYHRDVYVSQLGSEPPFAAPTLYETVPVDGSDPAGVALQAAADGSLWIALAVRPGAEAQVDDVRRELGGRTLSLGVVPAIDERVRRLTPSGRSATAQPARLDVAVPVVAPDGRLEADTSGPRPRYRSLDPVAHADVLLEPGVLDVTLPAAADLRLWTDVGPLDAGVGELPPSLQDTDLGPRVVTWLRVRAAAGTAATILWVGVNAASVAQRDDVVGERLPDGTGDADQVARLAHAPVLPETVRIHVTEGTTTEEWHPVADLASAGSELALASTYEPPGSPAPPQRESRVFALEAATGEVRFGDGVRGRRPGRGAVLRATYAHSAGAAGNVGPGSVKDAPALGAGLKASNPLRTWGGADAETVAESERQVARHLQHRDRAVSAEDFALLTWRTPGVELARVEVLAAFDPQLSPSVPGDAPGVVTVMVVPRHDHRQPDAPEPERPVLDAVCRHLDPRRLVTTEIVVRGPRYRTLWVSIGIETEAGHGLADVREAVRTELRRHLAPVDPTRPPWFVEADVAEAAVPRGWPLRKSVARLELLAVAARVRGVRLVRGLLVAEGSADDGDEIPMRGLDLPWAAGIAVVDGDPRPLDDVRGTAPGAAQAPPALVPVPVIPETC